MSTAEVCGMRLTDLSHHMSIPENRGCNGIAGNMAPKFRRALADKLAQHAPMFGLSEVAFPSFELQNGWNRVSGFSQPGTADALLDTVGHFLCAPPLEQQRAVMP